MSARLTYVLRVEFTALTYAFVHVAHAGPPKQQKVKILQNQHLL